MSARVALGALGAGALAALLVPGHRAGLGVALTALAVTAVGLAAARGRIAREPALLALALCPVALLRDAGWVVWPSVLATVALASAAVAGGRTWAQVARGPAAVGGALAPAANALAALVPRPRRTGTAARGLAAAVVLVAVFGALFASADAAFARIAGDLLTPGWDLGSLPARAALLAAVTLVAAALALVAPAGAPAQGPAPRPRLGRAEWTVALIALDALFAAFVVIQIAVLFGGDDHVVRTAGLTYAEYAREGFAQLLVVAALTLGLTALAGRTAPRAALAVLLALTLVVVASALHRLGLYQEAFGFTRLRLLADAIGLWLGALIVLVLALGGRGVLPRAALAVTALAWLALVAIDPDARIAAHNVDRYERTGKLDLAYARVLSADAAPALAQLPPRVAACALAGRRPGADGLGGANLARARARGVLRRVSRCSA